MTILTFASNASIILNTSSGSLAPPSCTWPHNWLLIYMRAILVVYTANAWYGVYQEIAYGWK